MGKRGADSPNVHRRSVDTSLIRWRCFGQRVATGGFPWAPRIVCRGVSVLISPRKLLIFFPPLDLQAHFIVDGKAMVGETEVKERPKSNPDYLMQLMNDRKVMSSLPNFSGIFTHLERLLDEGNSLETLNPPQKSELSFVGSDVNKKWAVWD